MWKREIPRFLGFRDTRSLRKYLKNEGVIREDTLPADKRWMKETWNTFFNYDDSKYCNFWRNLPIGTIIEGRHRNAEGRFFYLVKVKEGWLEARRDHGGDFVEGGIVPHPNWPRGSTADQYDIDNFRRNFWLSKNPPRTNPDYDEERRLFEQVGRVTANLAHILVDETKEGLQEVKYPGSKVVNVVTPCNQSQRLRGIFPYLTHIRIVGIIKPPVIILNNPRGVYI